MLFAAVSVIWGMPYLFIKVAVDEISPSLVAWSRLTIAAAVLLPLAWRLGALRGLASRWKVPAVTADYHEVASRARAAVVALPHHLHAPVSIDLLRSGVHVLVEKPMATSAAQCDAMLDAARVGDRRLAAAIPSTGALPGRRRRVLPAPPGHQARRRSWRRCQRRRPAFPSRRI